MPIGHDIGRGAEPGMVTVRRLTSPKDDALVAAREAGLQVAEGRFSVHKYDRELAPENLYEIVELAPNLFLTAGVTILWNLIAGVSGTHADATNARLCVGDSSAAGSGAAQVDLVGTNLRKVVSGAPVISTNQITFSSSFSTSEANFAWLEVGVANAASGQLVSRTTINTPGLGTKVNTAVWVLNWTLSIS